MLYFKEVVDQYGRIIEHQTNLEEQYLLNTPKLNKGSAFSTEERETFKLLGKLPYYVETLDEQVTRFYAQYQEESTDLAKNIYLNNLRDTNEVLFFKLIKTHLSEMLPIVYTPTVGQAVEAFSKEIRRARGLQLSYPNKDKIADILQNRLNPNIDVIVMSDGEGVLGIGDQGIGGMYICLAKLAVYTLCGGINPNHVLPIQIDVGTNNQTLLNDPMYLGWRHERLRGEEYDDFVDTIITAINHEFPSTFVHWEDFGFANARKNLDRYVHKMCTFNDDIQGTGAVTLSALLAAVQVAGEKLRDQRIVIFGAGTAGTGVADQIYAAMRLQGLNEKEARERFWFIDRAGLLTTATENLSSFQAPYARDVHEVKNWKTGADNYIGLKEVVENVKPTVLIGCSAVAGAFRQDIIETMANHVKRPIIFPLSNPTSRAEAHPTDLLKWTKGTAQIATGSPFGSVNYEGREIRIPQSNNALVFPGIGLGVITTKAKRLTDEMIWTASQALSNCCPANKDPKAPLLPSINDVEEVSIQVALAVAKKAIEQGLNQKDYGELDIETVIRSSFWHPRYIPLKKIR